MDLFRRLGQQITGVRPTPTESVTGNMGNSTSGDSGNRTRRDNSVHRSRDRIDLDIRNYDMSDQIAWSQVTGVPVTSERNDVAPTSPVLDERPGPSTGIMEIVENADIPPSNDMDGSLTVDHVSRSDGRDDQPWRRVDMAWNQSELDDLEEKISNYTPNHPEVGIARIMLVGQIGAGKSSFINTLRSALLKEIVCDAYVEHASETVTTKLRIFKFRADRMKKNYCFEFIDTMGLEMGSNGTRIEDIGKVMEGHVPDGYVFNPESEINPNTPGFEKNPELRDQVHAVAFVVDEDIQHIDPSVKQKIAKIKKMAVERNIRWSVIITKIDRASPHLAVSVKDVYKDVVIRDLVEHCHNVYGVRPCDIMPIKNYMSEANVEIDKDILALSALQHLLGLAKSTLAAHHMSSRNSLPLLADSWIQGISCNFNSEELVSLRESVIEFDMEQPVRILLVGPHNAGKSSVINTLQTAMCGTRSRRALVRPNQDSAVTTRYEIYQLRSAPHHDPDLRVFLCDTMGFMDDAAGMCLDDLERLIDGVKNGQEFNPLQSIDYKRAKVEDNKINALIIVVDGSQPLSPEMVNKLQRAYDVGRAKDVAVAVFMTHPDKICTHVQLAHENVCKSAAVRNARDTLSRTLGIPLSDIFLLCNYDEETVNENVYDIVALHALYSVMKMTRERLLENRPIATSNEKSFLGIF